MLGSDLLLTAALLEFGDKTLDSIVIPREANKLLLVSCRVLAALLFVSLG